MDAIRILISQQNAIVGDISGNLDKARAARLRAAQAGADLVVLSELFLSGYPPEDLVLNESFLDAITAAAQALAAETSQGAACLIGAPWREKEREKGREKGREADKIYNAALLLENGRIAAIIRKNNLPNYAVFDEARIFARGSHADSAKAPEAIAFHGAQLGIRICEDIWTDQPEKIDGADMMIVLNGSPFDTEKMAARIDHARACAAANDAPLIYVNQVGGQDELVFDGASFVMTAAGQIPVQAPAWQEADILTSWEKTANGWQCSTAADSKAEIETGMEAVWQAMMIGLRDYVEKNRFRGVVFGLSGGIDSATVAAIATDALGADRVRCVMMPSRFTSEQSCSDARAVAKKLGVRLDSIPIEPMMGEATKTLQPFFANQPADATEENIQSRLRGVILMALSNKFGDMLLSTGNKSEISVGYATLYGDMNGGFNPIKDIYKTRVYEAARWRNAHHPKSARGPKGVIIAPSILDKPPSAELRAGQKDEDSLPPYHILDDILAALVDEDLPLSAIIARGHDAAVVKHIARLVRLAEYKRRQAPPGIRIGKRNFGRGRRYPITNNFFDQTDE